jgi:hypothetical protein
MIHPRVFGPSIAEFVIAQRGLLLNLLRTASPCAQAKTRARQRQNNPTGKSPETASSPSDKNILIFRSNKSVYSAHIPSQQEGAFRERHGRRGGDAVDATARETGEADADGEIVWS